MAGIGSHRGRLRDVLAAAFLFAASAGFVWWQNSRVAVLWDLGYLLDSSWRMALGQMPYRDFPFVHPPGTFLIQAGLMKLFGRHYLLSVAWAALASGLGSVVAWRIVLRVLGEWWLAMVLATPLTVLGLYAVYPHPIYDGDCVLAVLVAVWLLGRVTQHGRARAVAAGVAVTVPVWFKQNIGFAFVAAVVGCAAAVAIVYMVARSKVRRSEGLSPGRRKWFAHSCSLWVLVGVAAGLAAGVAVLAATAGVGNYWHWTVRFAAERRMPGTAAMLEMYRQASLLWMLPVTLIGLALAGIGGWRPPPRRDSGAAAGGNPTLKRADTERYASDADEHSSGSKRGSRPFGAAPAWLQAIGCVLVLAPWLGCVAQFVMLGDDPDSRGDALLGLWPLWLLVAGLAALFALRKGVTLKTLLPLMVLAAVHGTFMSQQLWGSTYALWPLLVVLIAGVLSCLPAGAWRRVLTAGIGAVLLGCGGVYAASYARLGYIDMPEGPLEHARTVALRGMADRGPYLANLDELVRFTDREIPREDAILLLPGEDPFYFATGRRPQFPVLLMDPATDPFSPQGLMAEAERRGVRWVIVKRVLQMRVDPMPGPEETLRRVEARFRLYRRLEGYDVYKAGDRGTEGQTD